MKSVDVDRILHVTKEVLREASNPHCHLMNVLLVREVSNEKANYSGIRGCR